MWLYFSYEMYPNKENLKMKISDSKLTAKFTKLMSIKIITYMYSTFLGNVSMHEWMNEWILRACCYITTPIISHLYRRHHCNSLFVHYIVHLQSIEAHTRSIPSCLCASMITFFPPLIPGPPPRPLPGLLNPPVAMDTQKF